MPARGAGRASRRGVGAAARGHRSRDRDPPPRSREDPAPGSAGGTVDLGGQTVRRLGHGATRITGDGVRGPPKDHDEAVRVLRRAVELGVTFIDTADSHGPFVCEDLIREALHDAGGTGTGYGDVDDVEEAQAAGLGIASVQDRYDLGDRRAEDLLTYCEEQGIAFISWAPVDAGSLARPGGPLDEIAKDHDAATSQLALAWLLRRSPVIVPIPGTSTVALTDEEFSTLEAAGR